MERLDDLIIDNMKIWQRTDRFCFSIDAVLLAHFPVFKKGRKYADFGTGTGVIPLLATSLGATHMTAVELDPIMASLAKKNVILNKKAHMIRVHEMDYRQPPHEWKGSYDGIVVNPPYYRHGSGAVSQSSPLANALHETVTTLNEVIESARLWLRFGGSLWMVYVSSNLPYCMHLLEHHHFALKRLRLVHDRPGKKGKLCLIEATYGGKDGMILDPPLFIHDLDGHYSEEVSSWYGISYEHK